MERQFQLCGQDMVSAASASRHVPLTIMSQALNGQLALRSGHGVSPVCISSWPVDYYVSGSQQAVRSALRTQFLSSCQIVLVVLLMYTTQPLNGQLKRFQICAQDTG